MKVSFNSHQIDGCLFFLLLILCNSKLYDVRLDIKVVPDHFHKKRAGNAISNVTREWGDVLIVQLATAL